MESVLNFLNSLDLKDETLVVACSGGSDSMFLLDLLDNLGYKVVCAHVNHKIREESDQEYLFVKNYCLQHDIATKDGRITAYKKAHF